MKNVIAGLLLIFIGAQANATSVRIKLSANLNRFQMQPNSSLAERDIESGRVTVNFIEQQISLSLQPAFRCPGGAVCAMVMPQPIEITLPYTGYKTGGCGELIYTAEKNEMPVDGTHKILTITDNRNNYCEVYPLIPTVVELQVRGMNWRSGQEWEAYHRMTGDDYLN